MTFGRGAAGQGDEKGFLFAIEFTGRASARLFTERILDTTQYEPLTHTFHRSHAGLERLSDDFVSLLLMRQAQNVGAHQAPGRDTPFVGQNKHLGQLVIRQRDQILFRHGALPFLSAVYLRKVTPQNLCGGLLVGYNVIVGNGRTTMERAHA